ncbi:hypothetical protein NECID01_0251 [Nematocida sp. AWRm77]|nr:hypothetical protein NECID01_0251 [Nematocida sp. AWRm77]
MDVFLDEKWSSAENDVSSFEYKIEDKDFPYDIDRVCFVYNHKRDSISLRGIDSTKVCDNVSIGYLRVRDRVGYKDYVHMVLLQLEDVLGGAPVQWMEKKSSPAEARLERSSVLDISESPILPHEPFVSFSYVSENIQALKCSSFTASFVCKRCGCLQERAVGDKAEVQKNTHTITECRKCTIHIKIDTCFHLIVVDGENKHNLLRISTFGLTNLTVKNAVFNCVCDMCSNTLVLSLGDKAACTCGYFMWLKGGKEETFREVVPLKAYTKPGPKSSAQAADMAELLKNSGTCKHYKKSMRIFIFPCCGRKYPCDTCHDEKEDHKHVLATKMVCGKCGTEESVNSKCRNPNCQAGLVGHTSRFWEGGKGSRNKATMSRKDKKKYTK